MAPHPAADLTGQLLDGRYRLHEVLGSGGMGAVHRAEDTRLQRIVAVKVLPHTATDDLARARMRTEARLAGSLHHVGVAQVFDYVETSESVDGLAYIVMEHVEGHSLAELLRETGPMPVEQVMSVLVQVSDALAAAHAAGVVHRDVKPANIMLTPAGRTVLVDFGIAWSDANEPLTATGTLIGTADYLSPEQAAGRTAGPLSDLYSLGVVAHHCLTGTSPFRRDSQISTAVAP
ncbi:MAG: serine/threonine protein kinase, partial [Actinomycetales bacterium]